MKNQECRISEPDYAIEMLVYFMHARIIDHPFCCKYRNDPAALWSLARIASMYCIKELAQFVEFLLAQLLIGNNTGRSNNYLHQDIDLLLNDYNFAHLFEYTKLAELMLPCVAHCIAKNIQTLETDSAVYKNLLKNGMLEDVQQLIHGHINFTTPAHSYETDYYYEYYDHFGL